MFHNHSENTQPERGYKQIAGEQYGSTSRSDRLAVSAERVVYENDLTTPNVSFVDSVLKHKWAVIGATILGGLVAFAITLPQTRIYRAHTSVEFEGLNNNVLNTRDVDPAAIGDNSSSSYINTQARILESTPLLEHVIARIRKEPKPRGIDNPQRWDAAVKDLNVATLYHGLEIRPTDNTKLIDIYVQSPDADLAAQLANTVVDEFVKESVDARWNASQQTSGWLGKQMEEVRAKLESSEAALQAYARRANLVFDSNADQGTVSAERLRQVQDEFSKAQADRMAKQSVYEGLVAEKPDDETAALRDPALQEYQMKLSELNRQLADLSTVYKPGYEKVQRLHSQIDELKKDYERQHNAAIARVRNDFQTAQRREEMLNRAYMAQQGIVTQDAAKTVEYNILKREVETNRGIYEAMMQRVKSFGIASALQPSNIRIVDPAEKPIFPTKPNVPLTTLFGMLGTFSLALVWAGVRQSREIKVEYPGQTKQALNIPELGVIPAARLDPYLNGAVTGRRRLTASDSGSSSGKDIADPRQSVETASWHHKSSLLAESVRSIRTSMLYGNSMNAPQVLVVTSLTPAHGKTSFVSNMGIAMAEVGRRTLMIDADLRRPGLHGAFSLNNDQGLTSLLLSGHANEQEIAKLIQTTAVPNLSLLSAGPYSANVSSSRLFHSKAMAELVNRLKPLYDSILIDTPPLTLSDARILGPLADGVVLVLRAGEVRMESVLAAGERLAEDGSRVVGTVLNNWNPKSNGYGSYPNRYYESSYVQSAK